MAPRLGFTVVGQLAQIKPLELLAEHCRSEPIQHSRSNSHALFPARLDCAVIRAVDAKAHPTARLGRWDGRRGLLTTSRLPRRSVRSAQRFFSKHAAVNNTLAVERHLASQPTLRSLRPEALSR